jgi:hypothetical protein
MKEKVLFANGTVLLTSKVWIDVPGKEQCKSFWGRLHHIADPALLFAPEGTQETARKMVGKPTPCYIVGSGNRAVMIKVEDVAGIVVYSGDPKAELNLGANVWIAEEDGFDLDGFGLDEKASETGA